MSEEILNIEMENVGVFGGKHKFQLKKGLNLIKAPNAKGKTSFTHGLELLILPSSELKGKGYYMNLYANAPNDKMEVSIKSNEYSWNRRFRRPTNSNNLLPVSDDIFPNSKINMANICFAIPENELMNSILLGKSIRDYIEQISGSKAYNSIIKSLENKIRNFQRQHQIFQDDLIRMEETQNNLDVDYKTKKELEAELQTIPEVDEEELLKNKEIKEKYFDKKNKKDSIDKKIRKNKGTLESLKQQINDFARNIERKKRFIADIESEHPKLTQKIEDLKDQLDIKKKEQQEYKQELIKIDDYLKSISENWTKMNKYKEEKCSACGRKYSLKELQEWEKECENTKKDYQKQNKILKREIEDLEDKINELQKQERQLSLETSNLAKLEKTHANRELEHDKLEKSLNSDLKIQKAIEKEIDNLLKDVSDDIVELKRKRERLIDQIEVLVGKNEETKRRLTELENRTKGAEILKYKLDFLEKGINFLKIKRDEIINKAADKFNIRINEIIKELDYKDFQQIQIKDDYKIYITREKDGMSLSEWPLEALSTSERYTLGITFLIAAKEEYLPEFPFFVIDEIVTSYDQDRMNKLKDYVANITDYVIITQLESESSLDELVIE